MIQPVSEDVRGWLASRPSNVTVDKAAKASTITWSGSLEGSAASGILSLDPKMRFRATRVD